MANMYNLLASVPPFNKYRIPSDAVIEFKSSRAALSAGLYEPDPHTITISEVNNKTPQQALETMAHEMVHLVLEVEGEEHHANHDSAFNALAADVCNVWGWNFKEF